MQRSNSESELSLESGFQVAGTLFTLLIFIYYAFSVFVFQWVAFLIGTLLKTLETDEKHSPLPLFLPYLYVLPS